MTDATTTCPRCGLTHSAEEPGCPRCRSIRRTNVAILATVIGLVVLALAGWIGVLVLT